MVAGVDAYVNDADMMTRWHGADAGVGMYAVADTGGDAGIGVDVDAARYAGHGVDAGVCIADVIMLL